MSQETKKSLYIREAQIAAFADERMSSDRDRHHVLKNIGRLATSATLDVSRVLEQDELIYDTTAGRYEKLPSGSRRVAASADAYVQYLRDVGGASYEGISGRAALLETYQAFAPTVAMLKETLGERDDLENIPGFLGRGSNSVVFAVHKDTMSYAVRVPQRGEGTVAIDGHVAAAVRAKGIPHVEQIVAASYDDDVTVAEIMPGKELDSVSMEELASVTDEQISEFIDTLLVTHARGLQIDPSKLSNFLYDQDQGFGIVDMGVASEPTAGREPLSIGCVIGWGAHVLGEAGYPTVHNKGIDEYAQERSVAQANLKRVARYRDFVSAKLDDDTREEALAETDTVIQWLQKTVENYGDEEWVHRDIATREAARRKQAEYSLSTKTSGWDLV